ncbi:valine--pyruvate transaminase [Pseudoalteromonas nigrifaciens]|uniref:Valine--pyruvate aminotransferase n=1 Tax=Pseudoalteromonas nigrifaciens TaxID=28109 RepID=A0AAC9UJ65_9GAMM|nr:valine--pyruvate transaminase [Pseudoalteromonas nigrifaciens]ASM54264.1 valine--pyruvate aminotransferase [Pseudoalteromonas nigrifaciens]GEN41346.1 valine--pyruvate transaminase [Pseudoalteromonas nigrifaciens]SUC51908.1 Aspartate aminotransferase [Pseudoalteromonas nigrifaciens]|tara:strand:- start:1604 stop:2866 length:1263 start_codon:yes stop_codon:yes gene_type:complete
MNYSNFGTKFTQPNGITQLMEDLGSAKSSNNPNIVMLGGGNPALVPQVNEVFLSELQKLVASNKVSQVFGLYDGPTGNDEFRAALASQLSKKYAWDISANNVALGNGSQANFFVLFNMFAGEMPDGSHKKILFPLAPEYVGYADQGLSDDMFVAIKPDIEILNTGSTSKQFKYVINFKAVEKILANDSSISALCVSRPTNPTGNVITDDEVKHLDLLAKQYNIPLIIDNAYGDPFPGCIYTDANLTWNSNIILCMSLSKLGLPGLRSGIVVANNEIIKAIGRVNGSMVLSPNSIGPSLVTRLINDDELLPLCRNVVLPFYRNKAQIAIELFDEIFADMSVYLHKVEGAFFMWLWFKDAKITSETLYQKLKEQDVYVIPGHNFFIGIDDSWAHKHECIRINYATDEATLRKGLQTIKYLMA